MTTGATGQLGLALPVQGELSGTWGDTVNNGITQYTNIAIAATLTLTNDGAVTLANTTGDATASNITSSLTGAGTVTAQFAIVRVTGTLTTAKVITAPSYSKTYVVVNAATGGIVTFKASGQTGVSIAVGESAWVYYNGTDYVKIAGTAAGAAGGSNTQVQYNSSGALAGSSNLTFDGTSLTLGGNPTLSAGTANGVTYLNGSKVLTSGSALTFDGTNLATTGKIGAGGNPGTYTQIWSSGNVMAADGSQIGFLANSAGAPANYMTGSNTSNYLAWIANNAEQMRLTSTGLGIGTSSPSRQLDVNKTAIFDSNGDGTTTNPSIAIGSTSVGFSYLGGSQLAFLTNSTERMRLDSAGNLGLGVTPSAWATYKALQVDNGAIANYSPTQDASYLSNAYYNAGWKYIASAYALRYAQDGAGGAHKWFTAPSGTAGNAISFTQAMTLDASGNLALGTTSAGTRLVLATSDADTAGQLRFARSVDVSYYWEIGRDNNSSGAFIFSNAAGGSKTERARISSAGGFSVGTTADPGAGAIYATGNITAYYSSDIKFKENVRDIPDALATVNAIGGKLFDWTDEYIESKGGADGYFVQKADFGVVAQDVQKVFPIAVRTRPDGSLAVDYEKLSALAMASIVELTTLVQTLSARVEALEAK